MTSTQTTLRAAIAAQITDLAVEADTKSHHRNYSKLHIMRDGTVRWGEFINRSDDLIDDRADGFQAIRSLTTVGTGSCCCNCDYCEDVYYPGMERTPEQIEAMYKTDDEAIADAVANGDPEQMESGMQSELDRIPVGYFDDEDEDAA